MTSPARRKPGRNFTAYGVCCNSDAAGSLEYIAGIEVSAFAELLAELTRVRIPEHRYLVFSHRDHVFTMRSTVYTIWNEWLPGPGVVEIWLPIKT